MPQKLYFQTIILPVGKQFRLGLCVTAMHTVNLLSASSVLLGLIALLLLWRQRHLGTRMRDERLLRQQADHALHDARRRLCRLASQLQQASAQERRRLGRDIHDDLGQHLLTLKMEIASLQASSGGASPPLAGRLGLIARHLDLSIASLRCVIDGLRPIALQHGAQDAIKCLLADFSQASGIAVEHIFELAPQHHAALARHETLLYRALQEALANLARHAHATRVVVRLRCQARLLQLSVADNGIGMADVASRTGHGLAGLEERLLEAGGNLHIASRPGAGTTLQLSLPLAAQQQPAQA